MSITHSAVIESRDGPLELFITVGLYDNGSPGEIFLTLRNTGDGLRGLARCWATTVSIALQYGVPLEMLLEKFKYARFEPAGFTGNPDIPNAQSVADYVARWTEGTFVKKKAEGGEVPAQTEMSQPGALSEAAET